MSNELFNLLTIVFLLVLLGTIILFIIFSILIIKNIFKKGGDFPKKTLTAFLVGAIFISTYILNWQNNSKFLPEGYLTEVIPSINGEHEARIYYYSGFIDYKNVRVSIFDKENREEKTIYYNFVDGPLQVEWISREKISINNLELNIHEDSYDMRNET